MIGEEIDIKEKGSWLVHSSGAGRGDHNVIVYDESLQTAIDVGLSMICEDGFHYKEPHLNWWDNDTIIFAGDDPWVVHVKKCNESKKMTVFER